MMAVGGEYMVWNGVAQLQWHVEEAEEEEEWSGRGRNFIYHWRIYLYQSRWDSTGCRDAEWNKGN